MNPLKPAVRVTICFGLLLLLELVTITAFCGIVFSCGCTLLQGMTHCNVHNQIGPRCPWCSQGLVGFYLPLLMIVGGSFLASWACLRIESRLWIGLLVGTFSYLALGILAAWLSAWLNNYPMPF